MRERFSGRRLARLIRPSPREEVDEELAFHLEQRVQEFIERGMDPETARASAQARLGDLQRAGRESAALLAAQRRAERRRDRLHLSWLDIRLGLRMLAKYPGLTLVGGIGMAVAIAIGAGSFGIIYAMMDPALPIDGGDRVVMLQNHSSELGNPNRATHLHDLETWRAELETVTHLGAFRNDQRNLRIPDGGAEQLRVAEMSASGFALARVPPLLGRPLLPSDEVPGAQPVIVIGEDLWRAQFGGDSDILGRTVQLGETAHSLVGVMPAGFRFPLNNRLWVPLRLDPGAYERGRAPPIDVFGRLAPDASLEEARAEAATITRRLGAEHPAVYQHIVPRVLPYTHPFFDIDSPLIAWMLHLVQALVSLLLIVVSVNVAVLVYARTAARAGEIAIRTAIGASRRRIVSQFFAEAFVLSALAAAAGLGLAALALARIDRFMRQGYGDEIPFWLDFGLSPGIIAYVAALAVLAGVIIGVLPALKATAGDARAGLQQLGGASSMRLGRTWTALIVTQVAIAVAALPPALYHAHEAIRYGTDDPGFPADEFLQAWLGMDRPDEAMTGPMGARFHGAAMELLRRIEAAPGVAGATFADQSLGGDGRRATIQIAAGTPDSRPDGTAERTVHVKRIAPDYFDLFDVPVLSGGDFERALWAPGARAILINRTFADRIFGSGNPLGRRIRYAPDRAAGIPLDGESAGTEPAPWYEVVGVVADFPRPSRPEDARPTLFHPTSTRAAGVSVAIRVSGGPAAGFIPRLRALAMDVDPLLTIHEPMGIGDAMREFQGLARIAALTILAVSASVLLLSCAGIYAMMSFIVARRRKEIGIRAALGARPGRLLGNVFSRALAQLAVGIALGLAAAGGLDAASGGELLGGRAATLLPLVAGLMIAIGLLAAAGPARRGLRVEPTEALRAE